MHIFRYVTKDTFDAYLFQMVETKQKFIAQIMTGKTPVRSAEDVDEAALSYAEIKMLATGNPHIKEKMDLDIAVSKLKLLKSNYLNQRYRLEDWLLKYYPSKKKQFEGKIIHLNEDVACTLRHPMGKEDNFSILILGTVYTERKEAGQTLLKVCPQVKAGETLELGIYRGFQMKLYFDSALHEYRVTLKNAGAYEVPLGEDAVGNLIRMENKLAHLPNDLLQTQEDMQNLQLQKENAEKELQLPFIQEKELEEKLARLQELNSLLNLDVKEPILLEEEEESEKNIAPSLSLKKKAEIER